MASDTFNTIAAGETAMLGATTAARHDAHTVLDHRARGRCVPRNQALPGHHLCFEDRDGAEFLLALDRKVTHLGRAGSSDVVIDDVHVSRGHAILVIDGNRARVLDDRSAHGTFVNGTRTVSAELNDGDVIRLGPVALTYVVVR